MGSRRERERTVKDYQSYTTADGRSLAQYAVDLLARGAPEADREADDILWQLATLVPDALLDIQMELVQREVVYPGFLFRGANPLVRDELIRRVLTADLPSLQRSHLLSALAWVGDPVVQRLFARFRHSPPPWRRDLFVPPEDYALEAGWHLKTSDERRDLAF